MREWKNKPVSPKPWFLIYRALDFLQATTERAAELRPADLLQEHPLRYILQRGHTKEWFGVSKTEVLNSDQYEHK